MSENIESNTEIRNESDRSKKERLNDILKLLKAVPPAATAPEAYELLNTAFEEVEGDEVDPMSLGIFSSMRVEKDHGKFIRYAYTYEHALVLGENGSIEIRLKPEDINRDDPTKDLKYIETLEVIFSKPGADGNGVWKK